MADLYDLIERVQVTLASSRSPGKEELRDLHGELTEQIRHANKRLRECDALMAKGHRTEAIQLAEQEPPLLDVVAVLDFAELPEWNDFVAELGLTVAPELQIDIAAELNRAYSEDAPLERHLKQFRLYSLARAPLRTRIALLRKIASLDPGNPVWESDQCQYEEVRLRQIKEEYQQARQQRDMEKLRELSAELRGKWLVEPDKQVVGSVSQAIETLKQSHALQRLRQVTAELEQARDDEDVHRAAELGAAWESTAKACGDADEVGELRATARRALSWIKKEQTSLAEKEGFDKAVDRLQRAIESGHDPTELERRLKSVKRYKDFELPPDVQDDYDAAVREHHRKRKKRLVIAAVSITAFLVLVAILILIWKSGAS